MRTSHDHIVCCVDRSEASRAALAEARRLRVQLGASRLTVLHVRAPVFYVGPYFVPATEAPLECEQWLVSLVGEVPGAMAVLIDAVTGYAPAEAVTWAERHAVDLLVAASHRGLLGRMALGSFARHLAAYAPCPVILIPPSARRAKAQRTVSLAATNHG